MGRVSRVAPVATDKSNRRPDIQGLRAVAVLTVVVFHAGLPVPGGFVGVDVFFVISGFVITGLLHREWTSTGRIRFGQFYLRRFQRLTPALALMVTVTLLISLVLLSPLGIQQTAAQTGIGAILLVANLVVMQKTGGYFDALAESNPLLHTWSLSVEEQFYLFFPAFICLVWVIGPPHRRGPARLLPYAIVAVFIAASFLMAIRGAGLLDSMPLPWSITHSRVVQGLVGFYSPLTRSWEFALGVVLALAAHRLERLGKVLTTCLGIAGVLAILGSMWLISPKTPFPGTWTLLPVVGTMFLLAAGTGEANAVSRALSSRPMVKIGDWSYSIYLWHWPMIVFAGVLWRGSQTAALIAAVASVIPAVSSYRWVEMPIRMRQPFHGTRAVKIIAATLLVPVLIGVSLLVAVGRGYWSPRVLAMQAAVQQHALKAACVPFGLKDPGYSALCTYNSSGPNKPIYVVGDSTAWHFSEAAIRAGELLGRPVTLVGNAGCDFADLYYVTPLDKNGSCRAGYDSTMAWLRTQPAGTVVITSINVAGEPGISVGNRPDALLDADAVTTDPARYWHVVDASLASTVQTIESFGHKVLLVQAAPEFVEPVKFQPTHCTLSQLMANTCVGRMTLSEADAFQAAHRAYVARVAAQTGTRVWDPRDFFCQQGICTTQKNGLNLYHDAVHISAGASQLLGPSLAQALASVG